MDNSSELTKNSEEKEEKGRMDDSSRQVIRVIYPIVERLPELFEQKQNLGKMIALETKQATLFWLWDGRSPI